MSETPRPRDAHPPRFAPVDVDPTDRQGARACACCWSFEHWTSECPLLDGEVDWIAAGCALCGHPRHGSLPCPLCPCFRSLGGELAAVGAFLRRLGWRPDAVDRLVRVARRTDGDRAAQWGDWRLPVSPTWVDRCFRERRGGPRSVARAGRRCLGRLAKLLGMKRPIQGSK